MYRHPIWGTRVPKPPRGLGVAAKSLGQVSGQTARKPLMKGGLDVCSRTAIGKLDGASRPKSCGPTSGRRQGR